LEELTAVGKFSSSTVDIHDAGLKSKVFCGKSRAEIKIESQALNGVAFAAEKIFSSSEGPARMQGFTDSYVP
jgi:hypothetical protein